MAISDPLGDVLSRIRNAQMRRKSVVSAPASRLVGSVLSVLRDEGYIGGYEIVSHGNASYFQISLKYFDGGPAIRFIRRISKPGRRVYASVKNTPRVAGGLGVTVLSTSKGVVSDHGARDLGVGGEILCQVF